MVANIASTVITTMSSTRVNHPIVIVRFRFRILISGILIW